MKIVHVLYSSLINLAKFRGYSEEEIQPCIVNKQENFCDVDVEHSSYPRFAKIQPPPPQIDSSSNNENIDNNLSTETTTVNSLGFLEGSND